MKFDLFCIFFFEIWKYMCWTMNLIDATCRNWSKLSSSGRCSKTLPKAQRTRGLSSSCQSNFLESYYKFKHKSWSNFIFRISTKPQLFNQASASPIKLKFKILTKLSLENSTKIQLHNLYKTSVAKCWTNSSSQINQLLPTWASVSTSARVTISTIKFTKQEWVSESVSQLVTSIANDRTRVR